MIEKDIRWKVKKYTDWVATLPCSHCGAEDGTVVAHHLKTKELPRSIRGGGMAVKVDDWLTMPLCYKCHTEVHEGDIDEEQIVYIFGTLKEAFRQRRFTFK
jgi:hypothetical protein